MKFLKTIASVGGVIMSTMGVSQERDISELSKSIYDYSIASLNGKEEINLSDFKGKKILLVNTASECGFTPQYKELQAVHEKYGDELVIIGFPCNQFGGQEPGDAEQIASFCEKNFGVTFMLTEKIDVKGANQHPIYAWLTNKSLNGQKNSTVKWNFQKYLIDEQGNLLDVYYSTTKPDSPKIIEQL